MFLPASARLLKATTREELMDVLVMKRLSSYWPVTDGGTGGQEAMWRSFADRWRYSFIEGATRNRLNLDDAPGVVAAF